MLGGKFLARGRVKKPGQELFKRELPEYFAAQDLYIGATLCLNNKNFQLLDADEYTFNYMEQHPEEVVRELKEEYLLLVVLRFMWGLILKVLVSQACFHCSGFNELVARANKAAQPGSRDLNSKPSAVRCTLL